jgi:hypothetical protein
VFGVDPGTGEVTDVIDAGRASERHWRDPEAVMNGIAALPADGEFLLTGKTWRAIRHVRLVPGRVRLRATRAGLPVWLPGRLACSEHADPGAPPGRGDFDAYARAPEPSSN